MDTPKLLGTYKLKWADFHRGTLDERQQESLTHQWASRSSVYMDLFIAVTVSLCRARSKIVHARAVPPAILVSVEIPDGLILQDSRNILTELTLKPEIATAVNRKANHTRGKYMDTCMVSYCLFTNALQNSLSNGAVSWNPLNKAQQRS